MSFICTPAHDLRTDNSRKGPTTQHPVTTLVPPTILLPAQPSFASYDNRSPALTTRLETVRWFNGCADSLKHRFIASSERQECDRGVVSFSARDGGSPPHTHLAANKTIKSYHEDVTLKPLSIVLQPSAAMYFHTCTYDLSAVHWELQPRPCEIPASWFSHTAVSKLYGSV